MLAIAGFLAFFAALGNTPAARQDDVAALLESRVEGCTICARMVENVSPREFLDDPHEFACASCHHPHTKKSAEEWRRTCQSSGCHPRAWTRSIYHRLDPEVFQDCRNCHGAHVWTVDGTDCASCHADIHGPEGTVPATDVAGVETFRHDLHEDFDCATCHRSEVRHAALLVTEKSQCMDCHHRGDHGMECASCHGSELAAATRPRAVDLRLSVWPESRSRRLPFDHERHRGLDCASCHDPGADFALAADCASCHQEHHRLEADCVTCHTAPADDAHGLAVHETRTCSGSGCHQRGFETMPLQRNFCVSCHQEQIAHYPGRDCASCHKIEP